MKMNNRWNRFIYRLWAPVYDSTVSRLFASGRQRSLEMLNLQPGERVLLVGVGTGADLPLLPQGIFAVGLDLSPDMLAHARDRLPLPGRNVALIRGDAELLPLKGGVFDTVMLNLILSVVPNGPASMQAALRAVKREGRIVVFDKFLPEQSRVTPIRRLLNAFSTFFGTDINRRFGEMVEDRAWQIERDEPSILGGMYRIILLKHTQ